MNINAQTRLCLLLGKPVNHSLSPALHNAGFRALGLNYAYLAAEVGEEMVGDAVKGLKALSVAGANVTTPFKKAVIPFLDSISEQAGVIQSVNTIVNRNGNLFGTSTDGPGFYNFLKESAPEFNLDQPAMLVGAGGAARAVAYTLAHEGISELYVVNRSPGKAEELAGTLEAATPLKSCSTLSLDIEQLQPVIKRCRLFIYSLPLDSKEFMGALVKSGLPFEESLVCDLRYSPAETAVMELFASMGGRSFNGLGMLLGQAALSFELFTGQKAPAVEMKQAIKI